MKKNASPPAGSFKRRSLMLTALAGIGALWAGPALLRSVLHRNAPAREPRREVSVTINPLAVPRTTKGVNRHG